MLPTILNLLVKQQRLSENTSKLVESMVSDVGKFREQSERIAIISNKIDGLERFTVDYEKIRNQCLQQMSEQFRQMELKREHNKDRINALEQAMTTNVAALREDFSERMRQQEKALLEMIDDESKESLKAVSKIETEIGSMAGKYGAYSAVIISIGMMVLKWVIDHLGVVTK